MMRPGLAAVFTAFLFWISLNQATLHPQPETFILTTARLAQTPGGSGSRRMDGPSALLDGYGGPGLTSIMDYPLGDTGKNYFWIELGISHLPFVHDDGKVQFEPRRPHAIRLWNGHCEDNRRKDFLEPSRARLTLYSRPLNDPDQDFGYPPSSQILVFEADLDSHFGFQEIPLDLPAATTSEHFPENMYMLILKLEVLETRKADSPDQQSLNPSDKEPASPREIEGSSSGVASKNKPQSNSKMPLAICEVQYVDSGGGALTKHSNRPEYLIW